MDTNRWSFQILLCVFFSESEIFKSPIVENTFIRDEKAFLDYPFEYSALGVDQGALRYNSSGKFVESDDGMTITFITGLFESQSLEYLLIEAIISRDKLQRS